MALVDGDLCLRKPFFQAMLFAGCVVEIVALAAVVTENLLRVKVLILKKLC